MEAGRAWPGRRTPRLCRRSQSMKSRTSRLRHIQVGKRRKARSSRARPVAAADVAVDPRRVRPVGLDGHDGEAVRLDQLAGDRGRGRGRTRAVPCVASPSRTTRASPMRSSEAAELVALDLGQRLGDAADRPPARSPRAQASGPGCPCPCQPCSPIERDEGDVAEAVLLELALAVRRRRSRRCERSSPPTGITSRPPIASWPFSASGTSGAPAATRMASKGAASGQPRRAVADPDLDVRVAERLEALACRLARGRRGARSCRRAPASLARTAAA